MQFMQINIGCSPSDIDKFPFGCFEEPEPIITEDGQEEQYIARILDVCHCSQGYQYLIWWCGFGQEHDEWLPGSELEDCEALDIWLALQNGSFWKIFKQIFLIIFSLFFFCPI